MADNSLECSGNCSASNSVKLGQWLLMGELYYFWYSKGGTATDCPGSSLLYQMYQCHLSTISVPVPITYCCVVL